MSKYKFNNGYIYRNGFRVPMPCVVVVLNEMQQKLEAYMKELPNFKATRENLEKIAKDAQGDFVEVRKKEGDKWTHVDSDGNECRILHTIGDHSWVTYKNNSYEDELWPNVELRVIKPTISASEAFRLCLKSEVSAYYVMSRYNVEEVSAND